MDKNEPGKAVKPRIRRTKFIHRTGDFSLDWPPAVHGESRSLNKCYSRKIASRTAASAAAHANLKFSIKETPTRWTIQFFNPSAGNPNRKPRPYTVSTFNNSRLGQFFHFQKSRISLTDLHKIMNRYYHLSNLCPRIDYETSTTWAVRMCQKPS